MNKLIAKKVIDRDRGCYFCNSSSFHLHHIVYKSHGGDDIPENLICLCKHHHDMVHTNESHYREILLERQRGIYGILEITDLKKKGKYHNFKY